METKSNEACCYKIEHGMAMCDQPTYQTKRTIKLVAKNGKDIMIDPKASEITPTTVCWPIEGHSNQL